MRAVAGSRSALALRAKTVRTGFTLVELLIVVAIIGVLVAMLLPTLSKVQEQAKRIACLSNLRQCYMSQLMYSNANKGLVPFVARSGVEWSRKTVDTGQLLPHDKVPVPDAWSIIQAYTRSAAPKVVLCPSRDPFSRNGDQRMWTPSSSQHWTKGFTTYPITAGSGPVRTGGVGPNGPYSTAYSVKMHKLGNRFAYIIDLLAIQEPAGADAAQIQTNHTSKHSIKPAGGNAIFIDGSGYWSDFNLKNWVPAPNSGIYVPKWTTPLNGYTAYTNPFWFSGSSPLRGYTQNTN